MKVEIYSDVVCPWCYIGERRFARALADFPGAAEIEVLFRPYQLDPAASEVAVPLRQSLAQKFGARAEPMLRNVTEVARGEGITIDWDRAVSVNTLPAHRVLAFVARERGAEAQRKVAEALFDAHFTRGANVADANVLGDIAATVGIEPSRVRDLLASNEGLAELRDDLASAREIGIRAVPTFVFDGRYVVEGAQSPDVMREALTRAMAEGEGAAASG